MCRELLLRIFLDLQESPVFILGRSGLVGAFDTLVCYLTIEFFLLAMLLTP